MESFAGISPHRPLSETDRSEIRIVNILPGNFDDPILCKLEHISLDAKPAYWALSYVWGDPSVTTPITLGETPYPVTANLHSALLHLRRQDETRRIWIDALCINQSDRAERSREVARMFDIYAGAKHVIAWVGDNRDDDHQRVKALFDMAMAASTIWKRTKSHTEVARQVKFETSYRDLLVRICQKPWFQRAWIIQEVVAGGGPNVFIMCGYQAVQLACLYLLWETLMFDTEEHDRPKLGAHGIRNLMLLAVEFPAWERKIIQSTRDNTVAQHLVRIFERTLANFKATEPHDQIYSALGLLGKWQPPYNLIPNYDLPVSQVYHQFTMFLVQETGLLHILRTKDSQLTGVPTWVPDLRFFAEPKCPKCIGEVSFSTNGLLMRTKGLLLGSPDEIWHRRLIGLENLEEELGTLGVALGEFETQIVIRASQLRRNSSIDTVISQFLSSAAEWWGLDIGQVRSSYERLVGRQDGSISDEHRKRDGHENLATLLTSIPLSSHFVLTDGTIASMVRRDVRFGLDDAVYMLSGSAEPCVLRKMKLVDEYQFLGFCRLEGQGKIEYDEEFFSRHELDTIVLI